MKTVSFKRCTCQGFLKISVYIGIYGMYRLQDASEVILLCLCDQATNIFASGVLWDALRSFLDSGDLFGASGDPRE